MRIIKLVTKTANGYRNWDRFRNRCMLILEKGIDFEIDKNDGSIKIIEKKDPDNQINWFESQGQISDSSC